MGLYGYCERAADMAPSAVRLSVAGRSAPVLEREGQIEAAR